MSGARRLWIRVATLARATLLDLFGEGGHPDGAPVSPADAALTGSPDDFQVRLNELREQLNGLRMHSAALQAQKRLAAETHRRAQVELAALDTAIDADLRENQDERARQRLVARGKVQERVETMAGREAELEAMLAELTADLRRLQERLAAMRHSADDLAHRERSASAIEALAQQRRALDKSLRALQDDFARREEQAARMEDRAAALSDLRKLDNEAGEI